MLHQQFEFFTIPVECEGKGYKTYRFVALVAIKFMSENDEDIIAMSLSFHRYTPPGKKLQINVSLQMGKYTYKPKDKFLLLTNLLWPTTSLMLTSN